MRQIDIQWGNLYQGYREVRRLQSQMQVKTTPQKSADRQLYQQRLERIRRHWQIRQAAYKQAQQAWLSQLNQAQNRFYLAFAVGGLLALAAFLSIIGIPLGLWLGWLIYRQYRNWEALRQAPPPQPQAPPELALEGSAAKQRGAALEATWWRRLAQGRGNGREQDYGTPGVEIMVDLFRQNLPASYLVLREVLVRSRLDVDLVVIGPNGIWLLECKHWAGEISCQNGVWSHTNTFHTRGGNLKEKITEHTQDPDDQWLAERDSIFETLRRRLPGMPWVAEHVRGGVVFTHPEAVLKIDTSTRAACGSPRAWLKRIRQTLPVKSMGLAEELQIVDALLHYASTLSDRYASQPSDRLAQSLLKNL